MTTTPDAPIGLYLILTDPLAGYEAAAAAAIRCNIRYLQLRMKNQPRDLILQTARRLRELTRQTPTRLIINDDIEIAIEIDADGVHLGQDDMPLHEARRRWNTPGRIFGLSTHNEEQARAALELQPDYIGVGPVYATPTKAIPDPVLGPVRAGAIIRATPLPAVAIGGINKLNLPEVLTCGARNVSVVRAVNHAPDPETAIRELQQTWLAWRSSGRVCG